LMVLDAMVDEGVRQFQCSTMLFDNAGLTRLHKHSPNAILLVGLQHPVRFFAALYNHQALSSNEEEHISSLEQLLGTPWIDTALQQTRFELFLMPLGMSPLSEQDMRDLSHLSLSITPTDFSIFVYAVEHDPLHPSTSDEDEPLRQSNICDPRFQSLRTTLMQQGTRTASWLETHFLQHPNVMTPPQLIESLQTWSIDPCDNEA